MTGICVLLVVLCVCLSLVSPCTRTPRPTTMSTRRTTTTPRPTTITTPPVPRGACLVDGKIYDEGATISRDSENCHGSVCMGGSVTFWDDRCFLNGQPDCDGQLVDIPGKCCHECVTTTSPPTTSPTTIPEILTGACLVNGLSYMDGEIIHRDPENCHFSRCSGGNVEYENDRCFLIGQPHCDGQLVDIPGQCCHECREYTTTTTSTTTSTPSVPPGACIVDGHVYMNGAIISGDAEHCADLICVNGWLAYRDDRCMLGGQPDCPNGHLVDIPGQCCHECIEDITTTTSTTTSSASSHLQPSAIVG
ncbi:kielin/chordin-like protein isoform X2 [Dreissena polymorpha]|uniref:Uncharacterized protein n=1 Tax=Dreissena polymorpha TaxID=45954 RepID=A0A9D4LSP8_DREPO|nr:kielin/chordin-like protein isoform X2 [Dreissena polymorpha]KAH3863331.1 hypothetical protein DPMN_026316 [Dreissena polymorpha]